MSACALNTEVLITRRPAARAPRCVGNVGEAMRYMYLVNVNVGSFGLSC